MTTAAPPPYPLGATIAPNGFAPAWTPMPQAPGGGYIVVPGFTYRVAVSLSGLASTLGTQARIVQQAQALGFDNVTVWMTSSALPGDWASPPSADAFIQARCQKSQTLPASMSAGVWPVSGSGTVLQASVWMYQPIGVKPAPPPGVVSPPNKTTSPIAAFAVGGLLLAGGVALAAWWERRRKRS